MNPKNIPEWYTRYRDFIEKSITKHLDTYLAIPMSVPLNDFKEIIYYSCQWGKKLRAILALEFYLQLSGRDFSDIRQDDDIVKLCIALEMIHAFSLIHDDLPCMDNDELRRGEPTVWKKYGEYQAVLVGDMLNSLCFEILSDIKNPEISQRIAKLISHSVGFYGMIGGQVEDLFFERNISHLDIDTLKSLHGKKTGKLIEASILWWVILSGQISNIEIFGDFGRKLWLAFQVKDDLLDVEGTPEETGKSVWGEEKGFVYLLWTLASKKILADIIAECKLIAGKLGSQKIDFIVEYVEARKK